MWLSGTFTMIFPLPSGLTSGSASATPHFTTRVSRRADKAERNLPTRNAVERGWPREIFRSVTGQSRAGESPAPGEHGRPMRPESFRGYIEINDGMITMHRRPPAHW